MSLYDRAVDEEQRGVVGHRKKLTKLLPTTGKSPSSVSAIDALPTAKALREIAPWSAASQDPNNGFEEATELTLRTATDQRRDAWRDGSPSLIGEEEPRFPHEKRRSAY